MASTVTRPLAFIGFMGAGKSTAAKQAATALGVEVIDTDAVFEERHGPIDAFFRDRGEAAFREREAAVVQESVDRALSSGAVVSLGGGAIETPSVRSVLRRTTVVWIDADAETCWKRCRGSGRPLAADRDAFAARFAARRPLYETLAQVVLPVAAAVVPALPTIGALPSGARVAWAQTAGGSYPVVAGHGVRTFDVGAPGRAFTVTDEAVAPHWAPDASAVVPSGESSKSVETATRLWAALVDGDVTRGDHLRAVGGGVVGDLTGFVAATYQRGVPVVQVPTTVVAQVDAAIGGKTGVDIPGGKNYVGVYHQPLAVLCDLDTLETLPEREHAAGYAEVVKTALIAGGSLWDAVKDGGPVDADVIFACARTKVQVVGADERDGGRRQVLNLGHTVAHAFEALSGFSMSHGEAVGLGLLAALRLSGQDELRAQVRELLASRGLPVSIDGYDAREVVATTRRDKKRVADTVPFVLVAAPGDVSHGHRVDDASVIAAVEELRS